MKTYDLVIVGGGIAGSATAIVMGRAGKSILLLEQMAVFEDRVRGEWIAPWGVTEVKWLGLYDLLMKAGGHHLSRHVTYDESRTAAESEARTLPLNMFAPDVPGPLCIGHPAHCQALYDEASRTPGVTTIRDLRVIKIVPGVSPSMTYEKDGVSQEVKAKLIVGETPSFS